MTNDMNAWFPALYLKKEADKRDLNLSELNSTIAMTMMLKGSPTMNMFLADSGLKRVEAEAELSKSTIELTKARSTLNQFDNQFSDFRKDLKAEVPKISDFITTIIPFLLYEDGETDDFKKTIRDLANNDHGQAILGAEIDKIREWFDIPDVIE